MKRVQKLASKYQRVGRHPVRLYRNFLLLLVSVRVELPPAATDFLMVIVATVFRIDRWGVTQSDDTTFGLVFAIHCAIRGQGGQRAHCDCVYELWCDLSSVTSQRYL